MAKLLPRPIELEGQDGKAARHRCARGGRLAMVQHIAPARHRAQQPRAIRAKRAAQVMNTLCQGFVRDRHIRPDRRHQIILGQHPALMLHQMRQQRE
jgi:hypothetical protein